jgi:malonyl-CoA decarboxylase
MPAAPEPLVADATHLLTRRASLLADRDDASTERRDELERVTAQLRAALDAVEPSVRRIGPDDDPALLERLRTDEPVHPAPDDASFRRRLAPDRRVFVLEHPALPGRALNVVFAGLCHGVAHDLAPLLAPAAETDGDGEGSRVADTAVFYSIWNVEPGLAGLPGGRQLLEGAIVLLGEERRGLETYATLSPVPGLRQWVAEHHHAASGAAPSEEELRRLAAHYLVQRREDGRPLDAVARFHLGNGARLLSLCPGADPSARGQERSFGLMANYRYAPEDRAANRRELRAGRPAVSDEIAALASGSHD